VKRAESAQAFGEVRPGKRVAHLSLEGERTWEGQQGPFWLIFHVTERTTDRLGLRFLLPDIELQGW